MLANLAWFFVGVFVGVSTLIVICACVASSRESRIEEEMEKNNFDKGVKP